MRGSDHNIFYFLFFLTPLKALDTVGNYSKIIIIIKTYLITSNGEVISHSNTLKDFRPAPFCYTSESPQIFCHYSLATSMTNWVKMFTDFMHMLWYTKWEHWYLTITKGVQCLCLGQAVFYEVKILLWTLQNVRCTLLSQVKETQLFTLTLGQYSNIMPETLSWSKLPATASTVAKDTIVQHMLTQLSIIATDMQWLS